MQPETSNHNAELRTLMSRAADAASYSGRKMMESAGLSWQSLAAWKAGTRRPRAENIHAVGHALLLRGDRIRRIGLELIRAAEQESAADRVSPVTDDGQQRNLFASSQRADQTSQRMDDDGADPPDGWGDALRPSTGIASSGRN